VRGAEGLAFAIRMRTLRAAIGAHRAVADCLRGGLEHQHELPSSGALDLDFHSAHSRLRGLVCDFAGNPGGRLWKPCRRALPGVAKKKRRPRKGTDFPTVWEHHTTAALSRYWGAVRKHEMWLGEPRILVERLLNGSGRSCQRGALLFVCAELYSAAAWRRFRQIPAFLARTGETFGYIHLTDCALKAAVVFPPRRKTFKFGGGTVGAFIRWHGLRATAFSCCFVLLMGVGPTPHGWGRDAKWASKIVQERAGAGLIRGRTVF